MPNKKKVKQSEGAVALKVNLDKKTAQLVSLVSCIRGVSTSDVISDIIDSKRNSFIKEIRNAMDGIDGDSPVIENAQ